jgi:hypothetical protein
VLWPPIKRTLESHFASRVPKSRASGPEGDLDSYLEHAGGGRRLTYFAAAQNLFELQIVQAVLTIKRLVRTSSDAVRFMRLHYRRFLSCFLLATFAGISLLGEGLHLLTLEAGHHHHHHHRYGSCIVTHATHDSRHNGRNFDASHAWAFAHRTDRECTSTSADPCVGSSDVDSHVCKICAYLFQAVSPPIEVAAPFDWQPLVVAVPNLRQCISSRLSLGLHAPRGPPLPA